MAQLDGLFNWTCTYSEASELTETHGVSRKLCLHQRLPQRDKFGVQLPGSDIASILGGKKR